MKPKPTAWVTTRDIVIPAGTRLTSAPTARSPRLSGYAEVYVGTAKDSCALVSVFVTDEIASGLIVEVKP